MLDGQHVDFGVNIIKLFFQGSNLLVFFFLHHLEFNVHLFIFLHLSTGSFCTIDQIVWKGLFLFSEIFVYSAVLSFKTVLQVVDDFFIFGDGIFDGFEPLFDLWFFEYFFDFGEIVKKDLFITQFVFFFEVEVVAFGDVDKAVGDFLVGGELLSPG